MVRIPHPPQEFEEERLAALTNFRCQRCTERYPNTPEFLVIQDGIRLCRPNCAFDHSPSEWDMIHANAIVEATELDSAYVKAYTDQLANAPNWSLMDGVSALTSLDFTVAGRPTSYPDPIPLVPGGSGVAVTGGGIGFTSADTLTFSNVNISATTPSIAADQTSFTTTISASSPCPFGDYALLFNGNTYPKAIRVRAA